MTNQAPFVHCPKCGQNIPLNGIGGERTTVSHNCTAGIIGKVYGFDCEETSGCASTGMAPESERAKADSSAVSVPCDATTQHRTDAGDPVLSEIREWLEWKMNHATKRMTEVNSFGRHHIPLDSQLNGYLQGERDCAIDALKQLERFERDRELRKKV